MAVNTTDYSSLEDAIRAAIIAGIGSGGTSIVQDAAIRIFNGEVDLDPNSFSEWGKTAHGPKIIITLESFSDEEFVAEGGMHPRKTWQSAEVALYVYDESLRGRGPAGDGGTRGLSGTTNSPGVWYLIDQVRASITGYVAGIHTLGWEGPFWSGATPVAREHGRHLWRASCTFRGCITNELDTSALDDFDLIHGDYNLVDSSLSPDPDLEDNIDL